MAIQMISLVIIALIWMPIKRKYIWKWFVFLSILYSFALLFYNPGRQEDLWRYYAICESIKTSGSSDVLYQIFEAETPLVLVYLKMINMFRVRELLPVITGSICFIIYVVIIKKSVINNAGCFEVWKVKICFMMIIQMTRYMDITGIRNLMATALFIIGLYYDLEDNNKKIGIFVYVIASLIHSVALFYLLIRVLVIIYNRMSRIIILPMLIIIPFILPRVSIAMYRLSQIIPLVGKAAERFIRYFTNEDGFRVVSNNYRYLYFVTYLLVFFITLIYINYFCAYRSEEKLGRFLLLTIIVSLGFINQRELFNRQRMLIVPLGIYFTSQLLQYVGGPKLLSTYIVKNQSNTRGYIYGVFAIYGMIIFSCISHYLYCILDYSVYSNNFLF